VIQKLMPPLQTPRIGRSPVGTEPSGVRSAAFQRRPVAVGVGDEDPLAVECGGVRETPVVARQRGQIVPVEARTTAVVAAPFKGTQRLALSEAGKAALGADGMVCRTGAAVQLQ
jgi:hypothetical protein